MSKLKPFDLEAAKAGAKVVTRDGRTVRIICDDAVGDYPVVALLALSDKTEGAYTFTNDGIYDKTYSSERDLFLLDESEPELTEFEEMLFKMIQLADGTCSSANDLKMLIKDHSAELLRIARRQLSPTFLDDKAKEAEMEAKWLKEGIQMGKEDALQDLPKWRRRKKPYRGIGVIDGEDGWSYLANGLYEIPIYEINTLPKEED